MRCLTTCWWLQNSLWVFGQFLLFCRTWLSSLIIGECSFRNSLQIRYIFKVRSGELERLQVLLDLVTLGRHTWWGDRPPKEFNVLGAELTFGHCGPGSCCADALEDRFQIVLQLFGSVCGNSNVIHIPGAFICLYGTPSWSVRKMTVSGSVPGPARGTQTFCWRSWRLEVGRTSDLPSAVRGKLVSNQAYKTTSCQRGVALHWLVCWPDDSFWCNHQISNSFWNSFY